MKLTRYRLDYCGASSCLSGERLIEDPDGDYVSAEEIDQLVEKHNDLNKALRDIAYTLYTTDTAETVLNGIIDVARDALGLAPLQEGLKIKMLPLTSENYKYKITYTSGEPTS